MTKETVVLISSASRTPYVRDILDALCYPKTWIMEFRYLPLWLSKNLRDPANIEDELGGRPGIIVFADIVNTTEGKQYRFYPVRAVTIVEPKFVGPVLYVPMILGDFFDYGAPEEKLSETWHDEIAALPNIPRIVEQPGRESSFVVKANLEWNRSKKQSPNTYINWKRAETGWESVVELLAMTEVFRECTFYHIESLSIDSGEPLVPVRRGSATHYEIEFDRPINLELSFYHRRAEYIEGRKLIVSANSDLFSGDVGREVFADYQYNRSQIHLLAKRRFERDVTTIRLEPHSWVPSPRDVQAMVIRRAKDVCADRGLATNAIPAEIEHDSKTYVEARLSAGNFFAAVPEIVIELSPPWWPILLAAALLIMGSVLVSLPQDSMKFLLQTIGTSATAAVGWAAFVRSIGSLFAFAAIVYVFRRWPLK